MATARSHHLSAASFALLALAAFAGCADVERTAQPAAVTSAPAATSTAASAPGRMRTQFASKIVTADAAVNGCKPIDPGDDPGCAKALTVMAQVAYDIRDAAEGRADRAAYAGVIKAVDDMEGAIGGFTRHQCFLGYRPSLGGGGSQRDQDCSMYGFSIALSWTTVQPGSTVKWVFDSGW